MAAFIVCIGEEPHWHLISQDVTKKHLLLILDLIGLSSGTFLMTHPECGCN